MPNNIIKPPETQGGFNVRDVLFVLFKHKWKIAFLTLLGLGAAAALFVTRKPMYASQAKLLVRYVVERSAVDLYDEERRSNNSVLNAEMEILRSADLALEVAEKVGPEKLVPTGNEASLQAAASQIRGGVIVAPTKDSNVIQVTYQNSNSEIAPVVLEALVQAYFEKHLEIHRSLGASEYVTKQADQARERLRQTEEALNKIKAETGIVSLTSSSDALEAQRARLREALMTAETELIEQRARLAALEGTPAADEDGEGEDSLADQGEATPDPESVTEPPAVPREDLVIANAEYLDVSSRLTYLRQRRNELLSRYTESNPLVASTQRQILQAEGQRRSLITRYPSLIAGATTGPAGVPQGPDLTLERARMSAITARAETLKQQEAEIKSQMDKLSAISSEIVTLERRKALDEEKYRYLETSMDRARADASLDPSKMPNIFMIERPTAPTRTYNETAMKLILGLAVGGLLLGVGVAFLIEMVIDPRVKRPGEIQTRLHLPLIMTIPYMRAKKRDRLLPFDDAVPRIGNGTNGNHQPPALPGSRNAKPAHFMQTYAEALRDRIIFNFGINNVTHKPKIIGVTGLSEGAGTSTIAGGIAKAFAEAPGVKVLFVDLNAKQPNGNPIFGKAQPLSLPGALQAAREQDFREGEQDLFYASAGAGPMGIVPMQLNEMMPYIRFSDYDYIVFDMPPLDQTSPTLSMAGLMDKVLLVLDADATSRDALQWGYSEMERGRADVSCVFNKARSHAPKWVLGEV